MQSFDRSSLSNMGIVVIVNHVNNKTHKKLNSDQQKIKIFFNKKKDALEPTDKDVRSDTPDEVIVKVSTVSSTETQSSISHSLLDDGKLTAKT